MKLTEQQRQLVAENLGLVNVHIRRFVAVPRSPSRQREYEDLYQEGCLALIQAAKTHDPVRHGPFAAYAIPRIHHAISVALYERFATVRVPAKAVKRARRRQREAVDSPRHRPEPALVSIHGLADESPDGATDLEARHRPGGTMRSAGRPWCGDPPTIRNRLRRKYEAAVRVAADRLSGGGRGREDRDALIRRFVEERLLIPEPDAQTPKRQLAREFRCSIGRVQSCEDSLVAEIRSLVNADEEFGAMIALARREERGMDTVLDPSAAAELERQALDGFARRFARVPPDRQGAILRDLVRNTIGSLSGFARRLFGQLDQRRRYELLGILKEDRAAGERDRRPDTVRSDRTESSESPGRADGRRNPA